MKRLAATLYWLGHASLAGALFFFVRSTRPAESMQDLGFFAGALLLLAIAGLLHAGALAASRYARLGWPAWRTWSAAVVAGASVFAIALLLQARL